MPRPKRYAGDFLTQIRDRAAAKFARSLSAEYLEIGANCFDQRQWIVNDASQPWRNLAVPEDRLRLAIKALLASAEHGRGALAPKTEAADPGELYLALAFFCRRLHGDLALEALRKAAKAGAAHSTAAAQALADELTADSLETLLKDAVNDQSVSHAALAECIGRRRAPVKTWLLNRLERGEALAEAAWALGRLPASERSIVALRSLLSPETFVADEVKGAAALALLRLHDDSALAHVAWQSREKFEWAALPLALGWGKDSAKHLLAMPDPSEEVVLALGITGDISCIEPLIALVGDPKRAAVAELALYRLTGVDLRTPAPEEVRDDELFAHELPQAQKPSPADPAGSRQNVWREYVKRQSFDAKVRYLFGQPFAPAGLVRCLTEEKLDRRLRQLAYEELVIRYGAEGSFETDFRVAAQERGIETLTAWVAAEGAKLKPGKWYFGGELDHGVNRPAFLSSTPRPATVAPPAPEAERFAREAAPPQVPPPAPALDLFEQATEIRRTMIGGFWQARETDEQRLDKLIAQLASAPHQPTLRSKIESGDAAELYIALRVLRRQEKTESLLEALDATGNQSPPRLLAMAQALSDEPEGAWRQALMQAAVGKIGVGHAPLALFVGMHRIPVKTWLLTRLERGEALEQATWALGRLPASDRVFAPLHALLEHPLATVRRTAMSALLRLGDRTGLPNEISPWSALPMALGGGEESVDKLLRLDFDPSDPHASDFILALGVCGSPRLVPLIAKALNAPELMPAAQQAMLRLTGNTKARLDPDTRYLFGEPYSPAGLVDSMERPDGTGSLRQLAYEELVIRHGIDAVFETELTVAAQRKGIAELRAALTSGFKAGSW